VSTINRTPLSYLFVIAAAEYVMRLLPPGTHDWNKFVAPEEIVRVLKQVLLKYRPIYYLIQKITCKIFVEEHANERSFWNCWNSYSA
jgi:2-polyprenyl-3-methyl-5-hydroxy-6-metoxy-1,4-benzoquinol methylase